MVLADKTVEKHFIFVKNGEKETKQPFKTEEEAMAFLPKVLELKKKARDMVIQYRVSYRDDFLYAPHHRELLYDKADNLICNPSNGRPLRKSVIMEKMKGKYYCPECGFHTVFMKDIEAGIMKCKECGISTNDFDVKTTNNMWETSKK